MIEFRFVVPSSTTSKPPVLQFRECVAIDASGAFCPGNWGPWQTVATVVVDDYEWQEANK